ncbi:coiled-coil domain-containing protein 55-domain containing protein [Aspergillus cavernicola]|uniref:Coiled-coil domain-containing protein 55-domain containing protein n=1 Tax=Aspergillus cavernicola TaxID=176166 RepID=A0ABR4IYJ0_9EURO
MPQPRSYGLNLSKKPNPSVPSAKRKKAVFDSDSDSDSRLGTASNETEVSTIGGTDERSSIPTNNKKSGFSHPEITESDGRPAKRKVIALGQGTKPKIKPLNKSSIFADEGEEDHDKNGGGTKYGLNKPDTAASRDFTNLSALHSSKKHAADAQELDPSIYSYDAVYESLHTKPEKKNNKGSDDGSETGPRYMTSLLRSAEVRKRDQLRARDKLLAKEREAEGDDFADKEKFVTAAYKAQQEELRRVEEEERARELEEEERRKKNGGSGMVGFYRDLLARGEEQHEAVMKATDEAAKKVQETAGGTGTGEVPEPTVEADEKTEAKMAADLNARGAHVAVNDEGQVVDKRQLLSAGLNVAPKPKKAAPAAAPTAPGAGAGRKRFDSRQSGGRAGQRERQSEMIAAQLEEQERQREEAEAARQKEIAERSRSQKSSTDVSSARERYLARKKEREAAAKGS